MPTCEDAHGARGPGSSRGDAAPKLQSQHEAAQSEPLGSASGNESNCESKAHVESRSKTTSPTDAAWQLSVPEALELHEEIRLAFVAVDFQDELRSLQKSFPQR